ncbi:MAG: hypothetical protein KF850_09530 [Labilithrix sp.]|nr:hypothetical protein [Labilithrix sp.]
MLGAVLCASAAHAQVPGEEIARRAFEEGVALEKTGDFAAALAKFKESEQIKATLGNRYHKAYCLEMTGKLAAALIEYEVVDRSARETSKAELVEAASARAAPRRVPGSCSGSSRRRRTGPRSPSTARRSPSSTARRSGSIGRPRHHGARAGSHLRVHEAAHNR